MRIPPCLKGFTLVELMIYIGILAVMSGFLIGILMTAVQVGERESASSEVTGQINFVMQTIQRLVRESSSIDIPAGQATSTLVLRMAIPDYEPTVITLAGGTIQIQRDGAVPTLLTNQKVIVDTLSFKKLTQYPGHDTVTIDIAMTYNSGNPTSQVSRSLHSAVARASAATFDDKIVPGISDTYDVGLSSLRWRSGFFSGDISISNSGGGIILKSPNGGVCRKLSIDDGGAIITSPATCP